MKRKPKYKVGEVINLPIPYYQDGIKKVEQYQRIVKVSPWPNFPKHPFGYTFLNGDKCNEKWIRPLTPKERGR